MSRTCLVGCRVHRLVISDSGANLRTCLFRTSVMVPRNLTGLHIPVSIRVPFGHWRASHLLCQSPISCSLGFFRHRDVLSYIFATAFGRPRVGGGRMVRLWRSPWGRPVRAAGMAVGLRTFWLLLGRAWTRAAPLGVVGVVLLLLLLMVLPEVLPVIGSVVIISTSSTTLKAAPEKALTSAPEVIWPPEASVVASKLTLVLVFPCVVPLPVVGWRMGSWPRARPRAWRQQKEELSQQNSLGYRKWHKETLHMILENKNNFYLDFFLTNMGPKEDKKHYKNYIKVA